MSDYYTDWIENEIKDLKTSFNELQKRLDSQSKIIEDLTQEINILENKLVDRNYYGNLDHDTQTIDKQLSE